METPENIPDEQALIQDLKDKGLEDAATKEMLTAWVIAQEEIANQTKGPLARINLSLAKARLFKAAGLEENASAHFEDALEQAWNERMDDLYNEIQKEV